MFLVIDKNVGLCLYIIRLIIYLLLVIIVLDLLCVISNVFQLSTLLWTSKHRKSFWQDKIMTVRYVDLSNNQEA